MIEFNFYSLLICTSFKTYVIMINLPSPVNLFHFNFNDQNHICLSFYVFKLMFPNKRNLLINNISSRFQNFLLLFVFVNMYNSWLLTKLVFFYFRSRSFPIWRKSTSLWWSRPSIWWTRCFWSLLSKCSKIYIRYLCYWPKCFKSFSLYNLFLFLNLFFTVPVGFVLSRFLTFLQNLILRT